MMDVNIPEDLDLAIKYAYEPAELIASNFLAEVESKDYGAFSFDINNHHIKFRIAKITPKKIGQFVTLWKRIGSGPIIPYDMSDPIDLFIVSVRNKDNFGQFIFPKKILLEKGIVSKEYKGGKRAMRVYPPWDVAENNQAKKSQKWQLSYFLNISKDDFLNIELIQKLFCEKL